MNNIKLYTIFDPKQKKWWSTSMGWVCISLAQIFTEEDKKTYKLPDGAIWTQI